MRKIELLVYKVRIIQKKNLFPPPKIAGHYTAFTNLSHNYNISNIKKAAPTQRIKAAISNESHRGIKPYEAFSNNIIFIDKQHILK